ncbi:MAG: hypothetical protein ABFC57_03590 [Veillonellales bacterium]
MGDIFRVAVHYEEDNGYIEYDAVNKNIRVELADETKRREVEAYLAEPHVMSVPQHTLLDFHDVTVAANQDVESFKLAVTRIWEKLGVHVDWSRPI